MKSFLFSLTAAVVLIGCSKMETEDRASASDQGNASGAGTLDSNAKTQGAADSQQALTRPEGPQALNLKWPDGRRFVYEITVDQVTSAGDSPFGVGLNSTADQHFTYAVTSTIDASNGNTRLELEFVEAKLKLDGMGNKLNYDSSNKNAAESIDPMYSMLAGLDVLMGQKLVMILTPEGQVSDVEGAGELFEKVVKAVPNEAAHIAQGILQEDQFKQLIQYPFLPESAVEAGDQWQRRYMQVFGINGAMEIDNTYTYLGQVTKQEVLMNVLSYEGKVTTDPSQKDDMMGLELSLENGTNSGRIKLDQVTGHIIESDASQEMTMVMNIPAEMKSALPEPPKISIKMSQKIRLKEVSDVLTSEQ